MKYSEEKNQNRKKETRNRQVKIMSVVVYLVYASRCFGGFLRFLAGLGPSVFFLFLGPAAATRWLVAEVRPAVLSGGASTMFSAEVEAKGRVK